MNPCFHHRADLLPLIAEWRKKGYKIVFTSGTFDLLHPGHVSYLKKAALYSHQKDKHEKSKLVVGVNSDSSVKSYKSSDRPINSQTNRAEVIAALRSVDAAFIFNETNNKENIIEIKPDYYLKAGDYNPSSMTSSKYLADWGGVADTIPFKSGYSTTKVIEKILESYSERYPNEIPLTENLAIEPKPAIFLDRDGVINEEVEYLHEPSEFKLLPGVLETLKRFQTLGFKLIIITNQAGIGLGYFSKSDFFKVNRTMLKAFHQAEILVDKIYYCPHGKEEDCACRKPNTGMIERAEKESHIDLKNSFLIGDKTSDIQTGKNMNLKTILVKTGHQDDEFKVVPDFTAPNILAAADWIENQLEK